MHKKDWFVNFTTDSLNRNLVVFFPHAGGSASLYFPLAQALSKISNVAVVELPGRGMRFDEPSYLNFDELVYNLTNALKNIHLENTIFFGHSMGALIAFECAKLLEEEHKLRLKSLIVSGQDAPHNRRASPGFLKSHLTNEELTQALLSIGGIPTEMLKYPDLLDLTLQIIRDDCKLLESYSYLLNSSVSCPLVCFAAKNDPVITLSDCHMWSFITNQFCSYIQIEGGHFAIFQNDQLFQKITYDILHNIEGAK